MEGPDVSKFNVPGILLKHKISPFKLYILSSTLTGKVQQQKMKPTETILEATL